MADETHAVILGAGAGVATEAIKHNGDDEYRELF